MQLSEHFTLEELTYSDTAIKNGIENKPTDNHIKVLTHTCKYLLEPLRKLLNEAYGCPVVIKITSGYRSKLLNSKIKGASLVSEHCKGQAVDIEAVKIKNSKRTTIPYTELYAKIKGWVKEGKISVNQCIQEKSGNSHWVHVSHSAWGRTVDKKEFLIYDNGIYRVDCRLK